MVPEEGAQTWHCNSHLGSGSHFSVKKAGK